MYETNMGPTSDLMKAIAKAVKQGVTVSFHAIGDVPVIRLRKEVGEEKFNLMQGLVCEFDALRAIERFEREVPGEK